MAFLRVFPFLREFKDLPRFDPQALPRPELAVTLLIPARNADESLEHTVSVAYSFLSEKFGTDFEIILVPNPKPGNTSDRSIDVCKRIANGYATQAKVRVCPHLSPPGKGAAIRTGYFSSKGRVIFYTDADLPYELEFFERAIVELERGFDLVSGNRRLANSHFHIPVSLLHLAYSRHRLGLWFNQVVRWLLPVHTTDTQAGIKALSRPLAEKAFNNQVCPGFFFDLEIFMSAAGNGFRNTELPVTLHLNSEKSTVRVLRESLLAGYWLARITYRNLRSSYGRSRLMKVQRKTILTGYEGAGQAGRLFLFLRWTLTPYLKMIEQLPPRGNVLDLGCGHGLLTKAIALTNPGYQVLGTDHDEARIALARTGAGGLPNLRYEIGAMEIPPQKFDAITMIDVMHYFPKEAQKQLVERAHEALVIGGRLLVREVEPENGLISSLNRFYEKLATATGFTRSRSEDLHFRNTAEWTRFFQEVGFDVRAERCSSPLFSDVLFVCERKK